METNNNIKDFNIAEALKYAPKGLKLYSPLFGECSYERIDNDDEDYIYVQTKEGEGMFYENGTYFGYHYSECLLFPSASHRCWNHWQNTLFLESIGSVCVDTITGNKFILGKDGTYFSDNTGNSYHFLIDDEDSGNYLLNSRYASPEEAKEFFDELEKNGYEWNGKMVVKSTSQPKFKVGDWVVNNNSGDIFQVTEIKDDEYCLWPLYGEICGHLRIIDVDTDYHLWTIQDAKDGDVLIDKSHVGECVFIFKEARPSDIKTDVNNPLAIIGYCGINHIGFTSQLSGLGFGDTVNCTYYPATKEQRELLFQKMKEAGYQWDVDSKKLIKTTIPIPKFRIGDIIKHKPTGQINTIKKVCSNFYILDNNQALFFESQDMWELAASKVEVTPQDKVPTSLEVYHAVNNIKSLGNKVSILADEILALKEKLLALEKLAKDSEIRIDALECGGKPFQCSDKAGDNITLKDMKS